MKKLAFLLLLTALAWCCEGRGISSIWSRLANAHSQKQEQMLEQERATEQERTSEQEAGDIYGMTRETQRLIVSQFKDAICDYAKVMPYAGGDTESDWAAAVVDSLSKTISLDGPFAENMMKLYHMQNLCTYGLGCK
ncbi:MAG: hypothetical protein J5771_02065 [Bacteroidales bacterium]|nr:hypothetical protein [Bacteroidales bacterium]